MTLKSPVGDIDLRPKDLEKRERIGDPIDLEETKKELAGQTEDTKLTRYIPAKVKEIIKLEHGATCAFPGCSEPAGALHHTQRFSLNQTHDPELIKPLCKIHHELAHNNAIGAEDKDPINWHLSLTATGTPATQLIDKKVRAWAKATRV
jgi:hypothetical protein